MHLIKWLLKNVKITEKKGREKFYAASLCVGINRSTLNRQKSWNIKKLIEKLNSQRHLPKFSINTNYWVLDRRNMSQTHFNKCHTNLTSIILCAQLRRALEVDEWDYYFRGWRSYHGKKIDWRQRRIASIFNPFFMPIILTICDLIKWRFLAWWMPKFIALKTLELEIWANFSQLRKALMWMNREISSKYFWFIKTFQPNFSKSFWVFDCNLLNTETLHWQCLFFHTDIKYSWFCVLLLIFVDLCRPSTNALFGCSDDLIFYKSMPLLLS